ncbi:hypothetical protein EV685_1272 [Sphaerotilus mobilis]|uniref:Uncharacterized protein n=1 Tax=Sphaerotilus mobilis TaxID=47994 RepID=A0A4Q7LS72_9BURK|nr:hypothetical protein EV685_1272 [Sphaerotilus mobilis]
MQKHLKEAVITTAVVLVTIFVARKIPMVNGVVTKALNG